jgi:DNA polymerase-3 subunit delta'
MAVNETVTLAPGSALYPWQEPSWRELIRYTAADRVPHALMISGLAGAGKLNLALGFANHLLCGGAEVSDFGCGQCNACRLIAAGTHPDLIRIEPPEPGKAITIDRIRDLADTLSLTSHYNRYRVVLFKDAERLNSAAANALLKTLEEPGKGAVLILITARCRDLPATIRSRCQRLDIPRPDHRLAVAWLEQQGLSGNCEVLLAMASGAPLKALALGKSGSLERRKALFSWWQEIAANRSDPVKISENLSSLPLRDVLAWMTGWTIDMIRLRMVPSAGSLRNPDLRAALQAEVQKLELKQLFGFYERLLQSASRIDTPANAQMLLESILIDWRALKRNREWPASRN